MMHTTRRALTRYRITVLAVCLAATLWVLSLQLWAGTTAAQHSSNIGLVLAAVAAGWASLRRARRHERAIRRFWCLLGAAALSWSAGQTVWTWYESVLGQQVPFPSLADWGYLGLPPLAAAALLSLPLAAPTLAGQVRTILDGLMVAGSLLLCSWIIVLGPVLRAGGDNLVHQAISLAYPAGDVVVITIVVYTWLRARQQAQHLPASLPLVGIGLLAFAVADSGFVYLTTMGLYSSGSLIDVGWFLGFVLMMFAALSPSRPDEPAAEPGTAARPLGNLLPYAAVSVALLTSVIDIVRTGQTDIFVSWIRTLIMVLLVCRQILTLMENHSLTRDLEHRVAERTAELRTSQQRFAALVQHSSDVVTVVDRDGIVSYQSESSQRVLGYRPAELLDRSLCELMDPDRAAEFTQALQYAASEPLRMHTVHSTWRHAVGDECRVEVTITNLLDNPDVRGLVLNTRDVTDRTVLEEQLVQQAFTDSLTGLPNRALFRDRLQHALSRRGTTNRAVAVLFLDLDGFKAVNDALGHSTGDELLVQVSERLLAAVRPSDTVARLGGDEFAVLVDTPRSDRAGGSDGDLYETTLAERINETMQRPFELAREQVHVAASVGIARLDGDDVDAEQLLRNADLAMYQAKAAGNGGYALYHSGMHTGLVERVRLEADLRRALDNQQLVLNYQPMICLRTGDITGTEALLRWQHPERGMVRPDEFIPIAESTGVINSIGLWVLREACRQTVRWQDVSRRAPLKVSVNMSARQLQQEDLAERVQEILAETGLPAERLTLEMTESVLIQNRDETLAVLSALRAMGVRLAIDDFGTGYSSLSYLHRFPVDAIKIDRSFIEGLSNGGDGALVSTILRLGQSMHLETVAEGIERPQEMLMLRRQGCTTGQGYYFSPPVSSERLADLLTEQDDAAAVADRQTPA
jgi:diguanylate cyclase (GGDEF)-like protein/PAS domain S-box-containing protein